MTASQPVGVHLVGSVPLTDTHAVFSLIGQKLGQHVCRIPDGETGAHQRELLGPLQSAAAEAFDFDGWHVGNVFEQPPVRLSLIDQPSKLG